MAVARLRYSLRECEDLLGVSEGTIRRRVSDGSLQTHMDGDRRFVSARALQDYIDRAEKQAAQAGKAAA